MIDPIYSSAMVAPDPTAQDAANTSGDPAGSGPAKSAQRAQQGPSNADSSGSADAATQPSTRLLIDQDKTTGTYVYRVVDAVDGRLLAEIPRESLQQLMSSDNYAAGDLISTSI